MKILSVVGARPNFVKIAPILRAIDDARPHCRPDQQPVESVLVHTEQHYDDDMSARFFSDLNIPRPDRTLGVGSGSHATQTAEIMRRFEPVLSAEQPQAVLVVGDVNSTIGCALVAAKMFLDAPFRFRAAERRRPVIVHVETGLRSHHS